MQRRSFLKSSAVATGALVTGGMAHASAATATAPAAGKHQFKLKYAPHFGMFKHSAGDDLLDQPGLVYATQVQYNCDDSTLPRVAQGALAIAQEQQYQPAGDIVPYCQNRYDQLLYTPGPAPALMPDVTGSSEFMEESVNWPGST